MGAIIVYKVVLCQQVSYNRGMICFCDTLCRILTEWFASDNLLQASMFTKIEETLK